MGCSQKIFCLLVMLYTIIPVDASHMAKQIPVSAHKTQAQPLPISVPSQVIQWLDNGIKRMDDRLLAEAEQYVAAITDPDQLKLVLAIFTKRFEICELFFATCWTGTIKKLEQIDTLNKELQTLHRRADENTSRALSNLDAFLEQYEEWSYTSAKQYIDGIGYLAHLLKEVVHHTLNTSNDLMGAIDDERQAANQEVCLIRNEDTKQGLKNLLAYHSKIHQQAHANQDSVEPPGSATSHKGLLAEFDNIPLFDINQVKHLLKQSERAVRPINKLIGTHRDMFSAAHQQLEEFTNQFSGLMKEQINFIEIHTHLAQAYLRANHTAVIVNHLWQKLTQKNRRKNRHNQVLYPLQLIVDEIHNGHDGFNVRALETVVKNMLETISIKAITIHITNKVETLLETTRELENGLQLLGGREATDLLFTLATDNDVSLQAKKAVLNAIREHQRKQINVQAAACTTKTTKKMFTALRYYTSIAFSCSGTDSSQTEKAASSVDQLTESSLLFPRSSTRYLLCFLESCTHKVFQLDETVQRDLPKQINAQLSELVKSYVSASDDQIPLTNKIDKDPRIISLAQQLRPTWQDRSKGHEASKAQKQKNRQDQPTVPQKVKKKRRGKNKRPSRGHANKAKAQDSCHRANTKNQAASAQTGETITSGQNEHSENAVDTEQNDPNNAQDLYNSPQSVLSAGRKSARRIRLSLKEYLQKVQSAFKKYFPETQIHTIGSHRCIHYRRDFSAESPCVTLYLEHTNQSNQIVSIPDTHSLQKTEDNCSTNWDFYHAFPTTVDQLIPELAQLIDADNPLLEQLNIRLEPGQHALTIRAKLLTGRRDPGLLRDSAFFEHSLSGPWITPHDGYIVYLIDSRTNCCFHRQFHPFRPH